MSKGICSVEGCERNSRAVLMCGMHYQRFVKYGSTDHPRLRPKPAPPIKPKGRKSLCDDQLSMFFPRPEVEDESSRRERRLQRRRQRRIENLEHLHAQENARLSRPEVKQRTAEQRQKYKSSDKGRYRVFVAKSKNRKIEMHLTQDQWVEITKSPCAYCGSHCFNHTANGYGIDRVDPTQGYTLENSVACCSNCNIMKHLLSVEDFIAHVRKIVTYQDRAEVAA